MTRVATTYYGADVDTRFQWATDDNDVFDRELDLSFLARAVERHDHSSTRGLAVQRVGNNVVGAAQIQAASISGSHLAPATVTKDKLAGTLVEATNDYAGGLRLADSTTTYIANWWMSANGFACFSATATAAFMINQAGQIAVGPSYPTTIARFNVLQQANSVNEGMRVTAAGNDALRFSLYWGASGTFVLETPSASIQFNSAYIHPSADQGVNLGHPSFRWANFYAVNGQFYGTLGVSSTMTCSAGVNVSGAITAQSVSANVGIASVFYGINTNAISATTITCGAITCTAINTQNNNITCAAIVANGVAATSLFYALSVSTTITAAGQISCGPIVCSTISTQSNQITAGNVLPANDNAYTLGDPSHRYILYSSSAFNISGAWQTYSDIRLKDGESIRSLGYGLNEIRKIRPIFFKYKEDLGISSDEHMGLVAQDVSNVVPEVVSESPHPLYSDQSVLSLQPGLLLFVAINAIKELADRLEALEARRN